MQRVILAVLLVSLCALVMADESETESNTLFLKSGTGLFPRQDTHVGRPGGKGSSIFGWMGSRLSRFPMIFRSRPPRPRQYGRPPQSQQYDRPEVVLPDPPGAAEPHEMLQNDEDEATFDDNSQEPNELDIGAPTHNFDYPQLQPQGGPAHMYQQHQLPQPQMQPPSNAYYQQQQQQHVQHVSSPPQLEVVKSQMISYNHHQQQYNPGPLSHSAVLPSQAPTNAALFTNEIPHSAGPVKPYFKSSAIPVVPQSTGPDYFDTAYTSQPSSQPGPSNSYQGAQQNLLHVSGLSNSNAANNYGATFHDIQQAPVNSPDQTYPAGSQQHTGFPFGSIVQSTHDLIMNSASSHLPETNIARPQVQVQQHQVPNQHPLQQQQQSKHEPSVQILSQGVKDGNPVFEVLADADAPLFDGQHPFDINKLIAMIEPGAVVDQPPQLSEASSETRDVIQPAFSFVRRR